MNQAVSRQILSAEARVLSQLSPYNNRDWQSDIETGISPSTSAFPVIIVPPILHIHIHLNTAITTRTVSKSAVLQTPKCCIILLPKFFCTFLNQVKRLLALRYRRFEAIHHKFHCKCSFRKFFIESEAGIGIEILIRKPSEQPTNGNKLCLADP